MMEVGRHLHGGGAEEQPKWWLFPRINTAFQEFWSLPFNLSRGLSFQFPPSLRPPGEATRWRSHPCSSLRGGLGLSLSP